MKLFSKIKNVLDTCHGKKSASEYFLNGGEDYELLFTASNDFVPPKASIFHKIGEVTEGNQLYFSENGKRHELLSGGWDHF